MRHLIVGLALAFVLLTSRQGEASLVSGLSGYWVFDGNGTDLSAGGRDLTLQGGVGFGAGLFGQALDIPGDRNQFAVRSLDDTVFDFGGSDFTIQVWVNYNTTSNEQVLLEKWSDPPLEGWTLTKMSGDRYRFATGGMGNHDSVPLSITTDAWHQVIMRRTGGTLDMRFDDSVVLSANVGSSALTDTGNPLLVGRRYAGDSRGFAMNGRLDEIAIWNRALSDDEIQRLYNGGAGLQIIIIPEPTTLLIWSLLAGLGVGLGWRRRK
jgi:hypothetical protein